MKRFFKHIFCFCLPALLAVSCVMDDPVSEPTRPDKDRGGAVTRIVIPGPASQDGTAEEENMTINTVRILVFDQFDKCIAKSEAISVSESDVSIEYAPNLPSETHHPAQYVIKVSTGLEIDRLLSGSATYKVYAVINETMGSDTGNNRYTGVNTGADAVDISADLDAVTTLADLTTLMQKPLPFTFNVENALPDTDPSDATKPFQEPAFIQCGYTEFEYSSSMTEIPEITINNQGLDRTMAKVTIESISSGTDNSEEASQLFVTGVKLVNIPKYVYLDSSITPNGVDEMGECNLDNGEDDAFGSILETGYFKRAWDGSFTINTNVDVTLKQEFRGIYYQNKKDDETATALGKDNYTPFPWDFSDPDYKNSNSTDYYDQYGRVYPNIDKKFRGRATLFPDNTKDLILNSGNYIDWLRELGPELDDATDPTLDSWDPHSSYTVVNDDWDLKFNRSYYIPENLYSDNKDKDGYPCIAVTVAIGKPYIPPVDPDVILKYVLDHWDEYKDKGHWEGAITENIKAEPVLVPKDTPGNPYSEDRYYYVFKSEGYYKLTDVEGLQLDPITSKDFDLKLEGEEASPTMTFYVPIAKDYAVYRNHEYKLRLVVNTTTFNAIPQSAVSTQTRSSNQPLTLDNIGVSVEREVIPLK